MATDDANRSLTNIRAENQLRYGTPEEAREYAEDLGGGFCETCHSVYHALPWYVNDGHQCLTDGTAEEFLLPE